MLLTSLDADTAAELLKGLSPDDIQEIALELARIDASGRRDRTEEANIAREFYNSLQNEQGPGFSIRGFLNEMIVSILGKEKAEQVQSQVRNLTQRKDTFADVRSASTDELVLALEGEHPQTIAVVLSELPPRKSQEVLSLLSEEARINAVCKMTNLDVLRGGVKERIASMVSERLKSFKGESVSAKPEQTLRKLAIMLSGLKQDVRGRLLDEIGKHDEEMANTVRRLMVTWEDIPSIADRSLQEGLRAAEAGKLAIALFEADPEIVQKIRSNISERLAATLDEEISLMQEPLEEEVLEARDEVVEPLRKASEEGTLRRTR
jgi:flagellar motor switch protein FliG